MKNGKIMDSCFFGSDTIEIIEIDNLNGASSDELAKKLFFLKESNVTLKFVRILLNGGILTTESGALYYSKGNIKNKVIVGGLSGIAKKFIKNSLTKEKIIHPQYTGIGEIVLEPSFSHFILLNMNNDSYILDKGIFYCSIGDIDVEAVIQENMSAALLGKDGMFQTRVSGSGVLVLKIDVPLNEIEMMVLNNEKLQVDGNFAILRSSDISYSVEKSSKNLFKSLIGGEGLLQTFKGTGEVWLAPTAPVYRKMHLSGNINDIINEKGNMNNNE